MEELDESPAPKSSTSKYPILFVDINLGNNKIKRITIYEGMVLTLLLGDNPDAVAHEFATQNSLSQKMFEKLQRMLKQQMSGILSRINEEDDTADNLSDGKILS